MLRNLGHRVTTTTSYDGKPAQMMVALHAWRSREAIVKFRSLYPEGPLVVALTGTDINGHLHSDPESTLHSMATADALVCFHDLVQEIIPAKYKDKLNVIYQSAKPLSGKRAPAKRHFDICVVGHLREVKDPLRTALAVRELPETSKIRVIQMGKAYDSQMEKDAETEMKINPRYLWKGEVSGWQVRREYIRTRLMVISSLNEGGANVISEAIVAGVPVVASEIDGNIGLLGSSYSGYYPVGDTRGLQKLLLRIERSPDFLEQLNKQCVARRYLFTREYEQENWRNLIIKVTKK